MFGFFPYSNFFFGWFFSYSNFFFSEDIIPTKSMKMDEMLFNSILRVYSRTNFKKFKELIDKSRDYGVFPSTKKIKRKVRRRLLFRFLEKLNRKRKKSFTFLRFSKFPLFLSFFQSYLLSLLLFLIFVF